MSEDNPLSTPSRVIPHNSEHHLSHMCRVAIITGLIALTLFFINRQWLRDNTLLNSPAFDALVYQNQSYDDYLLLRKEGLSALYKKYTDGRWHVPPLYPLSGTFTYLLLGRDPANFYVAPAIWFFMMLLSTYGYIHYWTGRWLWATIGAGLIITTPSLIDFGLRVSQTDFSVGAAFTLATYILVATGGLLTMRGALLYAISASVCLLIKSSIGPYFLAHILIGAGYLLLDPANRKTRLVNAASMMALTFLLTGWFFFNNMRQIIAYYTEWGGKMSAVTQKYTGINSWVDHAVFYLRSFAAFHLKGHNLSLYFVTAITPVTFFLYSLIRKRRMLDPLWWGIGTTVIWAVVPYTILSLYQSKAYSVDFPYIAVFYIFPILCAASVFRKKYLWPAAIIIFVPFFVFQAFNSFGILLTSKPNSDWHEKQVLTDIFKDADLRKMNKVSVSNAFIHKYLTAENLRYFVVNGTFKELEERYVMHGPPYSSDPEKYYKFLLGADYVLAKSGAFIPSQHPNNIIAPDVNKLLENSKIFSKVKEYLLPDGTTLMVFRNEKRFWLDYPKPMADGWIGPRFPVTFYGNPDRWKIEISGHLPLPNQEMYPARLFFVDINGEEKFEAGKINNAGDFNLVFEVTKNQLGKALNPVTLYLTSDKVFRPSDVSKSLDTRELLLILGKLEIQTRNIP